MVFSKLLPFIDQINVAVFNFILVFIPSILMSSNNLLKANLISLTLGLCISINNALIYQPFLKFLNKEKKISKRIFRDLLIRLYFNVFIGFGFLIIKGIGIFDISEMFLILFFIITINHYELMKRICMLNNRWGINSIFGTIINLSWLLAILIYKNSLSKVLIFQVIVVIICTFFLKIENKKFIVQDFFPPPFETKEFKLFGLGLLGAAISFWIISGGYLLIFKEFFNQEELNTLRLYHNFFSGFLILFVVLDNYLLSGFGQHNIINKLKLKSISIISIFIVLVYSVVVYLFLRIIYGGAEIELLILFGVIYSLLSLIRVINSKYKLKGKSREVMFSQVIPVFCYIIIFLLYKNFSDINSTISSIFWTLSLLIGISYLLINQDNQDNYIEIR
jgi:hypothetical protein